MGPTVGTELAADLAKLHDSYKRGNLRLMLGAGVSMASGLPGWNELNRRLLTGFFSLREANLMPEAEELRAFAETFAERFGREAVVDLVRDQLRVRSASTPTVPPPAVRRPRSRSRASSFPAGAPATIPPVAPAEDPANTFHRLLHGALYPESRSPELHALQYEIAAFCAGHHSTVYTFNYDQLIEEAVASLRGKPGACHSVYDQDSWQACDRAHHTEPRVTHLHGMLPCVSDGVAPEAHGQIIFSEKDYFEAGNSWNWSKTSIQTLLTTDSDIVLVGLSLADPRLRSILRDRLSQGTGAKARVWAIFTPAEPTHHTPLEQKRALRLLKRYETDFWKAWDIKVLRAENHEVIPFLLRRIRLGDDAARWWEMGRDFLAAAANPSTRGQTLYEPDRQKKAFKTLSRSIDYLRSRFAITRQEEIGLAFFVPTHDKDDTIRLAFHIREGFVREEMRPQASEDGNRPLATEQHVTHKWAKGRELKISMDTPEGVTGRCFVEGVKYEAKVSSALLDMNFSPEQKQSWTKNRTFQWIMSVPVMDSSDWVPVGVACITSNQTVPFWQTLATGDALDLDHVLRALYRELVDYGRREELQKRL